MKYCDFNGCTNKIAKGKYCTDHKRAKPRKKKQKNIYHHENKSFYNSSPWQDARSFVYERERGCCQRCGTFVFGRRAHVHHVIPIKKNANLNLDPKNLRLLCPTCHTIEENEGNDTLVVASYFKVSPPTPK